jgi:hypothetical protein
VRRSRPTSRMAGPRPSPIRTYPILDRLTFNGTIFEAGTQSYRLALTKGDQDASRPKSAAAAAMRSRACPTSPRPRHRGWLSRR